MAGGLRNQAPTYCDSHHVGAPWGVLWDPGNVVVRGELGDIIIGVQKLDHNVCGGTELLWGIHFNGQELEKDRETHLSGRAVIPLRAHYHPSRQNWPCFHLSSFPAVVLCF